MKTPPIDTVYKSYIDAYHAAAIIKKQNVDMDTVVRIEKVPYSDGYVVRSVPVFLEYSLPRLIPGMPGTPARAAGRNPNYSDKK